MDNQLSFQPDWISPPGETIKDLLEERRISIETFSEKIEYSINKTTKLLRGDQSIDDALAEKLASTLGSSVNFWLKREEIYRNDVARLDRKAKEEQELEQQKLWLEKLPTKDMVKYGWIQPTRNWKEKAKQCMDFFKTDTIGEWYEGYERKLLITAFRTSKSFDSNPESIVTWLRKGEIISSELQSEAWNAEKFTAALYEARKLTRMKSPEEFLPILQNTFLDCGVTLVIAPTPSGCRASGATFFSKEGKAVIMLSFRYLSDDHFWFTLFHEAAHILLHGKDSIFLEGVNCNNEYEDEANRFSQDLLIPQQYRSEFMALRYHKWRDIPRFARKIGISVGIVVGQLQHAELIGHHQLNKFKNRYRWADSKKTLTNKSPSK